MVAEMKRPFDEVLQRALLVAALACASVLAACNAAPEARETTPAPRWRDVGTVPETVAVQRETRFYRDEKGNLWDDTGKRVERAP